jgi:cytochrome c biogenesis protein CcdA
MGILGWVILLAAAAVVATVAQFLLFARDRRPTDYDWVYIAGGALIGGFTGHAWYPSVGPAVDGLAVLPALVGLFVGAVVVEAVYRLVLRPRQA